MTHPCLAQLKQLGQKTAGKIVALQIPKHLQVLSAATVTVLQSAYESVTRSNFRSSCNVDVEGLEA